MDNIMELIPLPLDIIREIMSYTIQKIPKTDKRYDLILASSKKNSIIHTQTCYTILNNKFVLVVITKLPMVLYTFVNLETDIVQEYILW